MPNLDFTNDADDSIIPKGNYKIQINECKQKFSQNTGEEFWELKIVILDGEEKDKIFVDKIFFSEKAIKHVKRLCKALELDLSQKFNLIPEMIILQPLYAKIIVSEYKNELQNKIDFMSWSKDPIIEKTKDDGIKF